METSEETDGSCISKAVEEAPVNDEQVENNHEANAATVASTPDQENHQQASSEADEALENGTNSSATSSTPASKSSSLIKLKYEYPAGNIMLYVTVLIHKCPQCYWSCFSSASLVSRWTQSNLGFSRDFPYMIILG